MMIGASGPDLYKSLHFLTGAICRCLPSVSLRRFVVALIAIKTFLSLIKRISFVPFAIYRFIVAAVVYMVFL